MERSPFAMNREKIQVNGDGKAMEKLPSFLMFRRIEYCMNISERSGDFSTKNLVGWVVGARKAKKIGEISMLNMIGKINVEVQLNGALANGELSRIVVTNNFLKTLRKPELAFRFMQQKQINLNGA